MSKGRILVTGASGFLGWNLLQTPWSGWEWTACANRHAPQRPDMELVQADLVQPGAVQNLLDTTRPDIVIHLAAATDLNACEKTPDATTVINVEVPSLLARHCAAREIRLLFTSSDMVFDGNTPPYTETQQPCPINTYGRQKAQAETRVLTANPQAAVCRMPLMFGDAGPYAHNFLPEWIGRLKAGQSLSLFTDEWRAGVSARTALEGLRLVLEQHMSGIVHLGGRERMSRYDFGRLLCEVWGFDPGLLTPVRREDLNFAAPRPANTFLDSHRAWDLGYAATPVATQLRQLKAEARAA